MKPTEELIGDNRGIVRQILGRDFHCAGSVLDAARCVFAKIDRQKRRTIPKPLRRGLVKCIIDTRAEYRSTYFSVMGGRS